jgi:hypothetical protein
MVDGFASTASITIAAGGWVQDQFTLHQLYSTKNGTIDVINDKIKNTMLL